MRSARRRRHALAILLLIVTAAFGAAACRDQASSLAPRGDASTAAPAASPPTLAFEPTPGYEAAIERLRATAPARAETLMRIVGLRDAGDPIHVVLAPESHALARGVPPGVAGYARADYDLAVLLPERVPRYPYDSLDVLLLHEVTHVLASRAAGGRDLPRWWSEGLALLASRGWSLEDRSRVVFGAMSGVPGDLRALDAAFRAGPQQVTAAYALSGALVHHLVRRHGPELVASTLARVAAGDDFEAAFAAVAGVPLSQDVAGFWRRYRLWYRWLPFLSSGAVLWAGVTALALLAGVRRRQRDAAIRRGWEEEERLEAERRRELAADLASDEQEETVH